MRKSILSALFLPLINLGSEIVSIQQALNDQLNKEVCFIENKGQVHDQNYEPRHDVLYSASARNMVMHVKNNGVSYQLYKTISYKEIQFGANKAKQKVANDQAIYRIDLNWINANSNFHKKEDELINETSNFYLAHCAKGILDVRSYKGITLNGLYNGIDLHYYVKDGDIKYDYLVAPNANYRQIQIEVKGAEITLNDDGSLLLKTPFGSVKEGQPIVFQNGIQLKSRWIIDKNILSFEIQNYNPHYQLIIDPLTRLWGTYYGGSGDDQGRSCITDGVGNVYLAGTTDSNIGIATNGSYQNIFGGSFDVFLTKFNLGGLRQWSTYYGGENSEFGADIATDNNGNIYFSGITQSSVGISTPNSHQSSFAGGVDAFIVKFNSSGIRQWSTYYGGSGIDLGSVHSDNSGNVYLVGQTDSYSGIATPGSHQTNHAGGINDAFLVKFNSLGVRQWGTYYGGEGDDIAIKVCNDPMLNIYLVGFQTNSNSGIATTGSYKPSFGGGISDAFLVKFNSSGIRQWGTYYGGMGDDKGYDICIDNFSNIYITGNTDSNTDIASTFGHQTYFAGGFYDAFLAKFNSSGIRQWGTYYGNSGLDCGIKSCTDNFGNIYLCGYTDSNIGISTTGSYQDVYGGGPTDVFFMKFNTQGVRQWSTYYGGNDNDIAGGFCLDNFGNIYLSGLTNSINGIANSVGHQPNYAGGDFDAFLVRFDNCKPILSTATVNSEVCLGTSINFSVVTTGTLIPAYSWAGPNSYSSTLQNPSIPNASSVHVGIYTLTVSYNGCDDIANIQVARVAPCNEISEVEKKLNSFYLKPNPNNGKFIIMNKSNESYDLSIYDQLGQLLYEGINNNDNEQIDLSNFSMGVYYAKINVNGKQQNIKFIIQ